MSLGTFTAILLPAARKDLQGLDPSMRRKVLQALSNKIEVAPHDFGLPLGWRAGGNLHGFYKLAVARKSIRIIYEVKADRRVSVVWVIAARSDDECYRLAYQRLEGLDNKQREAQLRTLLDKVTEDPGRK